PPHPEEPPKAASRRAAAQLSGASWFETLATLAPHHEEKEWSSLLTAWRATAALRHASAQEIMEMHDTHGLAAVDHDQLRLLGGVEQLQRLADELIRPHRPRLGR